MNLKVIILPDGLFCVSVFRPFPYSWRRTWEWVLVWLEGDLSSYLELVELVLDKLSWLTGRVNESAS